MGDTAAAERRLGATNSDVLGAGDAHAPPERAERSGIARLESSGGDDEVALALDAQMPAQPDTLLLSELEDWIALAKRNGACGLVLAQDGPQVMVLGSGGAVVPTAQCFRDALGTAANPSLSFVQLTAARVRVLSGRAETWFDDDDANLAEVRVAVIHPDREIRSRWQRHMAFADAEVLFDEVEDTALPTLGESAPDLLVIHEDALCDLARAGGWRDVRLQFSALLVVSSSYASEVHPDDLVSEAADLLATQASLRARIAEADVLLERVESLGPARWLREAQGYDGLVELRMHVPQGTARVCMDNGELHEASYWRDGEELQGFAALKALQEARCGSLIVGRPEQVADADPNERLHGVPSWVPQRRSTLAPPPVTVDTVAAVIAAALVDNDTVAVVEHDGPALPSSTHATPWAYEVLRDPSTDVSSVEESVASAPSVIEMVAASPELQSEHESSPHPDAAPTSEFWSQLTARAGVPWRSRAISAGTLAVLATVGGALWWSAPTAPTSRPRPTVAAAPSAAEPAARPSAAPSAEAVVVTPPADSPSNPIVTEALAPAAPAAKVDTLGVPQASPEEALSVAQPAAVLGAKEAAAGPMPSSAQPAAPPPPAASQQAPAPGAAAPRSTANVGALGGEASTSGAELPVRLRRWLQPTPAQQRVIDAFRARADKNFIRAERLLVEAHALDPNEPEAAYQLALTYARQGRLEQTLSWARKARELSPLDPAPVALEGDVHVLRGQRLDAERVWKQCLQIRPGDPGCVRRLEQLKARPGR